MCVFDSTMAELDPGRTIKMLENLCNKLNFYCQKQKCLVEILWLENTATFVIHRPLKKFYADQVSNRSVL